MSNTTAYQAKFKANLILRGKINCLTGLHIGGSKEKLEIGGVDSPVIRNPKTRMPYIPGSSLKGKLRHLLEFALGVVPITGAVSEDKQIVRLFGIGADDKEEGKEAEAQRRKLGAGRLVVRDCNPDAATKTMWENLDSELLYTEYKPENSINRITSAANPRFVERVVEGSNFDFEMVYSVYVYSEEEEAKLEALVNEDIANLKLAVRMLEHNFLGKSGSRGYGRVRFHLETPQWVTVNDYKNNTATYQSAIANIDDKKVKELEPFSMCPIPTYKA